MFLLCGFLFLYSAASYEVAESDGMISLSIYVASGRGMIFFTVTSIGPFPLPVNVI